MSALPIKGAFWSRTSGGPLPRPYGQFQGTKNISGCLPSRIRNFRSLTNSFILRSSSGAYIDKSQRSAFLDRLRQDGGCRYPDIGHLDRQKCLELTLIDTDVKERRAGKYSFESTDELFLRTSSETPTSSSPAVGRNRTKHQLSWPARQPNWRAREEKLPHTHTTASQQTYILELETFSYLHISLMISSISAVLFTSTDTSSA